MMKKGGASKRAKPVKDPYANYIRKFKEIKKPKGAKRLGKMGGGMMKRPMMKEGGDTKKKIMKGAGKILRMGPVGGVAAAARAVTKKIKEKRMKKMGKK
jgi:hypothetical protein